MHLAHPCKTILAALMLLPSPSIAQQVGTPVTTTASSPVAGLWKTDFGPNVWTLRFVETSGVWTGQYNSSQYNKWRDLIDLKVRNGNVSFSIVSSPKLTFEMTVSGDGKEMTGSCSLPDGRVFSQNATRVP